ncbi:ABC transporter permease, partial [Klebsiella pneumoniae]|nr:ABC transporter permease [Klebsiella pneumoniae]
MKLTPNWGWASLPALLVVWIIVASHYPSYVLPQPWDVWREAVRWFSDGSIWAQLGASLLEEFAGFVVAVVLAMILGVSAGLSDRFKDFLTP